MKNRLWILVLWTLILTGGMVACSLLPTSLRRQARLTSTPTRTLKPTFTPTVTPSPTPLPSDTPIPTPTPTKTPFPTHTLPPTDTPTLTPMPTDTPLPSATLPPTPRPTRRPTATPTPKPTKIPPPPFTGSIVRGYTHCGGYAGVTGLVKHTNGSPYPGVAVGVWSDVWQGRVAVSEANGKFELSLTDVPVGKFKVAVVKLETCSLRNGLPTATDCQRLSNVLEIVTTAHCTGTGANQVTEIHFVGP